VFSKLADWFLVHGKLLTLPPRQLLGYGWMIRNVDLIRGRAKSGVDPAGARSVGVSLLLLEFVLACISQL
jgi:hypothetical protein